MTARLRLVQAGPWVSVQDFGRRGHQRSGISEAGAMDPVSLALANRLLGNPAGAAALEIGAGGLTLEAEGATLTLALAGPSAELRLDGAPAAANRAHRLEPGQRLRARPGPEAAYAYLSVAGGLDLPEVFASRAFHARSGLGGIGRPLASGDALAVAGAAAPPLLAAAPPPLGAGPIRVIEGPQIAHLAPDAFARFLAAAWQVDPRSDRMGLRLSGPPLAHSELGADTISDGIALGSLQLPGSGQPIVLGADRQTTGGYPKFAVVARADMPRCAQTPPGGALRFRQVSRAAAVAALGELRARLAAHPIRPAEGGLDSAQLLSVNLIGGVVGP